MLLLDEPTNHTDAESVAGWNASCDFRRHRGGDHPRPLLRITWPAGSSNWTAARHSMEGNYSSRLEQKDARLAQEASAEAARRKSIEKELEWVRPGCQRPSVQRQGPFGPLRRAEQHRIPETQRNQRSCSFHCTGDKVVEVSNLRKSYGDRLLIDDLSFSVPKGQSSASSARTARVNPLFRMMSGQGSPTPAASCWAIPSSGVRRSVPRQHGRLENRVGRSLRRAGHHAHRQHRDAEPRLCRPLQLQGRRSGQTRGRAVRR